MTQQWLFWGMLWVSACAVRVPHATGAASTPGMPWFLPHPPTKMAPKESKPIGGGGGGAVPPGALPGGGGRLQLVLMQHPPPAAICQNLPGGGGGRQEGEGRGYWQLGGGAGGLRATHYYHMHTSRRCLGIEVCMR